ncbi:MAG: hypothetical protein ABID54_09860, partial [Pseudomonadota bacterium]
GLAIGEYFPLPAHPRWVPHCSSKFRQETKEFTINSGNASLKGLDKPWSYAKMPRKLFAQYSY